ncbi:MAG: alpha/beta fold hydrolase [Candidatus Omnitrophica bacterium]|nr:alpha/beta fold hydrolase [Candidatus Omnitrophota bacterium]
MLNYKIAGHKTPFVLVHAWPLASSMWAKQLEVLKDHCRLITPDIPGLGKSARQKTPSVPEMACQVAALLDHLNIQEPVVIGGLSMGGYVTLEFLRQFPERVRGVCLLATRANADTPEIRERRFKNIEFLESHPLEDFFPRVISNLLGKTTLASNPRLAEDVKAIIRENAPEGICDTLRAMAARVDSTELIGTISCPALVMAGDEDGFVTAEESKAMHARIPGAEFHLMKNTGHLLNLERPQEFEDILAGFLARHF